MRTGKLWAAFRPYLWITLASAVFALGFDWCYVPNQITLGGMTGLGQIIHAIVPRHPGGQCGHRPQPAPVPAGLAAAGGAPAVLPLRHRRHLPGVDLLAACYSFPPMDPMLASVFGGALIGLSLGMVFLQGATTGGTDLIARLLKLRFGHLPMGTLVMAVDLVVIALAALAFHSLSSALYGLVSLYISSLVIDRVLYGLDNAKVAYIISDRPQEIIRSISAELERGVTILRGPGPGPGRQKTCSCAPSNSGRSCP